MTEEEARRRKAISKIGAEWPNGWTRQRLEHRVELTSEFPAEVVEVAVMDVIASHEAWSVGPTAEMLLSACRRELEARRRTDSSRRSVGPGVGCPHCGPGGEAGWVGLPEVSLVSCPRHRMSWHGVLRPESDVG